MSHTRQSDSRLVWRYRPLAADKKLASSYRDLARVCLIPLAVGC
ncbi:Uncharacterised protein [Vibrio cholerae]|nr:Uncharacterised protein [Vibrio cholerae]CSD43671.1 Uncharacterised protein [Vibrio cholerae]